jgi:hypothetical protein
MPTDHAIHSDFFVHWTGKDLDQVHAPTWREDEGSFIARDSERCTAYLERLFNILRYGLWLTEEPPVLVNIAQKSFEIPATPKVCFTELKLSQSRIHAGQYGRLGIGVKRAYLFA